MESLNTPNDYTATLASIIDERIKLLNNIHKGIDLAMSFSRLFQLRETLRYIQKCIFWEGMVQGYCSESNLNIIQHINEEINICTCELNNKVHKAITDKILEQLAEFAKSQLNNSY